MKIVSNNTMKDVIVIKHFNLANEEYVLYKNENVVSVGLVNQNRILAPAAEKINLLMQVIGNLISDAPNEAFNTQNACVLLPNEIPTILEELSYQNVNIPEAQLTKIIGFTPTPNVATTATPATGEQENKQKKPVDNKMKIYGIIIVVLALVLGILLLSGKSSNGSPSSAATPTPNNVVPTAADSCPNCVYSYYEDYKRFSGENKTSLMEYSNDYQQVIDANGNQRNRFLGHILVDTDNKIDRGFACGIEKGKVFCLEGTTTGSMHQANIEILKSIFGEANCSEIGTGYSCSGDIKASTYSEGNVKVLSDDYQCQVYNTGDMGCQTKSS